MATVQTAKDQFDIGVIISAPTKDKDWVKKCLLMGLLMLIPIAGMLNLMGWSRVIAERRLAGGSDADTLPDANLDYIGPGWRVFVSFLPLVGLAMLVLITGGVAVGVVFASGHKGDSDALGIVIALGFEGAILIGLCASAVLQPAIMFLHIVEGEPWASMQFGRIVDVLKRGGMQYLLFFVATLIASAIGQVGLIACYIGMFLSIPFAQAMTGAAIAEFARVMKPVEPSFPIEGGTGGASGSPFGVKL